MCARSLWPTDKVLLSLLLPDVLGIRSFKVSNSFLIVHIKRLYKRHVCIFKNTCKVNTLLKHHSFYSNMGTHVTKKRRKSKPAIGDGEKRPLKEKSVQQGGDDNESDEDGRTLKRSVPSEAGRRRIEHMKNRHRELSRAEFEASRALAANIAELEAPDQSQWLWDSYKRHIQVSELERNGLTAECFAPLPRSKSLEEGLRALDSDWQTTFCRTDPRVRGEPSALFISPAATGCLSMIRACPEFNRRCRIAKLFAKHLKVPQQIELLKEAVCVAAGTPHRLGVLADHGALQCVRLKWIVVDVRLDVKQRTLLDMPEVRSDWWTLWQRHLRPAVCDGGAKLVLYSGASRDPTNMSSYWKNR